jgi:hypothetical protein
LGGPIKKSEVIVEKRLTIGIRCPFQGEPLQASTTQPTGAMFFFLKDGQDAKDGLL